MKEYKAEVKNIQEYNFVNNENIVIPNYDLSKKEVYFDLYISLDKSVCIIGRLDNNYICWISITSLEDREINAAIFDYVAKSNRNIYSHEYKAIGNEKYSEIRNWYNCTIVRSTIEKHCWQTPFGHYYGDDIENHGKYFARDICTLYDTELEKCELRITEGYYEKILIKYIEILTKDNDYAYYNKMKPLISILGNESYLRLCTNKTIRELYLKCMKECSTLYNRYMTEVR